MTYRIETLEEVMTILEPKEKEYVVFILAEDLNINKLPIEQFHKKIQNLNEQYLDQPYGMLQMKSIL